jgi:hypothetical protein
MSSSWKRVAFSILVSAFVATGLLAQAVGGPVPNWEVPPYRASGSSGGITTMVDISDASIFYAVAPCRVFDTRNAPGAYGGPRLTANTPRNFDIDSGPCTGIPAGAAAYSMSFAAILPDDDGFLTVWPAGSAQPLVSSMNFLLGEVIANAAIVPAGTSGSISVFASQGTHLLGDINGYFMDLGGDVNTNTNLQWHGNTGNSFMFVLNRFTGAGADFSTAAIQGQMNTTASNVSAVIGRQTGASGVNFGVLGRTDSGTNGAAGVRGVANSTGGYTFGVKGVTNSLNFDAAGVKGVAGLDPLGDTLDCSPCHESGVRGIMGNLTFGYGVMGISRDGAGVAGHIMQDATLNIDASGYLGADFGIDTGAGAVQPWGVFSQGNSGTSGTKAFVEPHPTDPSKIIRYISLEGPEAGTYFRGKGRFQNGIATIEVPEDFRFVTDPEGLSIQVTPIGQMATVAVESIGLDRIVVRGSRNVEFFYTVNGVRATFKDLPVIIRGNEYAPQKAEGTIPRYLSERQKRLLIQNGTYNADGTINMETAKSLGWDRIWEARERPQPQPEPLP